MNTFLYILIFLTSINNVMGFYINNYTDVDTSTSSSTTSSSTTSSSTTFTSTSTTDYKEMSLAELLITVISVSIVSIIIVYCCCKCNEQEDNNRW